LLSFNGTFPYYYIYNNSTNIINLTHIESEDPESGEIIRGVVINSSSYKNIIIEDNNLENKSFMCDSKSDYNSKTITYYDEYRIELPINEKESIVLKSMKDVDERSNLEQDPETICNIYDETLKKAKPIEVYIYIYILKRWT